MTRENPQPPTNLDLEKAAVSEKNSLVSPLGGGQQAHSGSNSQLDRNCEVTSTERVKFYSSKEDDDDDEDNDTNKIIEESPNGRWSKLDVEISVQKLTDFDSANLAIDPEKGLEIAWNEMRYNKQSSRNRFESAETLRLVYEKLEKILKFLVKINHDHANLLRFYDYWFVENEKWAKLVVITEYSAGGSLKKLLDNSGKSQNRVKTHTSQRWLNQIIYLLKCLHNDRISLFQGNFNSETIFIQSSGVIKLAPTLLSLNGICTLENGVLRISQTSGLPKIELNDEIKMKDFHALGRLAVQIFTAHVKPPGSPGNTTKNRVVDYSPMTDVEGFLTVSLGLIDEKAQKDFIRACFESNQIESIWFHPFLNCIYSLKALSVFSIFAYFQEKRQHSGGDSNNNNSFITNNNMNSKSNTRSNYSHLKMTGNGGNSENNANNSGIYTLSECDNDEDDTDTEQLSEVCSSTQSINKTMVNNSNVPYSPSTPITASNQSLTNMMSFKNRKYSRKVSLTFLTNVNDLKIPQDFFVILEDIRAGLYPRLFKDTENLSSERRSIPSAQYIDFVIHHKKLIDRRASLSSHGNIGDLARMERKNCSLIKTRSIDTEDLQLSRHDSFELNYKSNSKTVKKYPIEPRRLAAEECSIHKSQTNPNMVELVLSLKFDDSSHRSLCSQFPLEFLDKLRNDREHSYDFNMEEYINFVMNESPFEVKLKNVAQHLTHELIDHGLINPKDFSVVADLFYKTIEENIAAASSTHAESQVDDIFG